MSRVARIVIGVVGWTLVLGVLLLGVQPASDILMTCGPVIGVDLHECQRQIAEAKASQAAEQRVVEIGLFALWAVGAIVAGVLLVREIAAHKRASEGLRDQLPQRDHRG